jgi:hypothetical protein
MLKTIHLDINCQKKQLANREDANPKHQNAKSLRTEAKKHAPD